MKCNQETILQIVGNLSGEIESVKLLKSAKMPKFSKEGSRHSDCKYMNPSMSDVKAVLRYTGCPSNPVFTLTDSNS